jgi:hypothetical protein
MKPILTGLFALFLVGWHGHTPSFVQVTPERVLLPGQLSVQGNPIWNSQRGGDLMAHQALWTVQGVPIDQVEFYAGLPPGQMLMSIESKATPAEKARTFETSMDAKQIIEVYESYGKTKGDSFQDEKHSPCQFAGESGFQFEFTQIRKAHSVVLKGLGFAAVHKEKLYLMVFKAPRIRFFDELRPQVEDLAASAKITD